MAPGARRAPLRSIAIVDENPTAQYLYPEFQLAQKMFRRNAESKRTSSIRQSLRFETGVCSRGASPWIWSITGSRISISTDPRNHVLRRPTLTDLAVVTPHPRAHALFADKQNLALLSDAQTRYASFGVADASIELLARGVPLTRTVGSGEEDWWRARKDWFFKPRHGFGSRGAYRGDKLTRRVFADVLSGALHGPAVHAAQRTTENRQQRQGGFKVDVRCYAYDGRIQLMAARLYQGQTTNFRTAGGGFAPVYVVSDQPEELTIPARPRN